jgi:hypothetical protein
LCAALIVAYSSLFTVYQTQQALVFAWAARRVVKTPATSKAPFIELGCVYR